MRKTCNPYAERVEGLGRRRRIVEEGPARTVVENPRHPYTRALISVAPRRRGRDGVAREILQGEPPDPVHVPVGCRFHPRCPLAVAECLAVDPELLATAADGEHRVACIQSTPASDQVAAS